MKSMQRESQQTKPHGIRVGDNTCMSHVCMHFPSTCGLDMMGTSEKDACACDDRHSRTGVCMHGRTGTYMHARARTHIHDLEIHEQVQRHLAVTGPHTFCRGA